MKAGSVDARPFWVLATAGVALRCAVFLLVPHSLRGDALHNLRIAANLLAGHGYSHSPAPPFYPDTLRPPLYSLYLALCLLTGASPGGIAVAGQIGMDLATAWFLWRSLPPRLGLPSSACVLLSPYVACFSTMLLSETMAVCLVAAWMALALRGRTDWAYWTGLGVLGALIGLCRCALIGLPLGGLLVLSIRTREWARGLASVAILLLCLLPWTWRNAIDLGQVTPLTAGNVGSTLYLGLAYDVTPPLTTDGQGQNMAFLGQWSMRTDLPTGQVMTLGGQLLQVCLQTIRRHPMVYLGSIAARAGALWWNADDAVLNPANTSDLALPDALAATACWVQRLLVLAAGVGLCRPHTWRRGWPGVALVVGITLLYAPIHVEARFMLPAEPAVATLAVLGCRRPEAGWSGTAPSV